MLQLLADTGIGLALASLAMSTCWLVLRLFFNRNAIVISRITMGLVVLNIVGVLLSSVVKVTTTNILGILDVLLIL